ncbi:carboxylesterase family protein [Myxococcus sp. K15C18031901]|nr:carboxylesterase family protein [Myxococcus dinghuensis]
MAGEKSRVVTTREGQVQGALNEGVWSFKGIPYAKPPVGSRGGLLPPGPTPRYVSCCEGVGFMCSSEYLG